MTTSKAVATPGPWTTAAHKPGSDYFPAVTLWPQGVIIPGISPADAQLIAAAPGLLAALADLLPLAESEAEYLHACASDGEERDIAEAASEACAVAQAWVARLSGA